jgi:hypothetical protein
MYDALGAKVDSLSEPDLLVKLEKLATVKTDTEVKAVNHHAMITMNNPVQQPIAHRSPDHYSPAHTCSSQEGHCQHNHGLYHHQTVLPGGKGLRDLP